MINYLKHLMTVTEWKTISVFLVCGFILRVLLTYLTYSFDAEAFLLWARYLTTHSVADVLEFLPEGYPPYLPFYYYILMVLGHIEKLTQSLNSEWVSYFIIRSPIYLVDFLTALLLYVLSREYIQKKLAILSLIFFYFHPAIIYNTAIQGQVDSLIIFLSLFSVSLLLKKKIFFGLGVFVLALLTKPQAFALVPLIGFLVLKTTSIKRIVLTLISLGLLGILPFVPVFIDNGILWTVKYFLNMPNWYPYTSIYSYNLWAPFGFIVKDDLLIGNLIEIKILGLFLFTIIALSVIYLLWKYKTKTAKGILFAGFLLWFAFAFFPSRIHSRYLIYTLGFIAPFTGQFPIVSILVSLFVVANLILPLKLELLNTLILWLNDPTVIRLFVLGTFVLFLCCYKIYIKILHEKKISN